MESIFESLNSLEVSESCFEDIVRIIFENVNAQRRENLIKAIQHAKDGRYRTKALKVLGSIQKKVNSDNKPKEDIKNSGITFTSKAFN